MKSKCTICHQETAKLTCYDQLKKINVTNLDFNKICFYLIRKTRFACKLMIHQIQLK